MKNLLLTGFFMAVMSLYAKAGDTTDSVRFCFDNYSVPATCTVPSPTEIRSDAASLSWVYVEQDNLLFSWNALLNKLRTYPGFSKEKIRCYISSKEVNGYRISFSRDGKTLYQLVAYGIVNSQPVLVQLSVKKNPLSNKDLPGFTKDFIRLTR